VLPLPSDCKALHIYRGGGEEEEITPITAYNEEEEMSN